MLSNDTYSINFLENTFNFLIFNERATFFIDKTYEKHKESLLPYYQLIHLPSDINLSSLSVDKIDLLHKLFSMKIHAEQTDDYSILLSLFKSIYKKMFTYINNHQRFVPSTFKEEIFSFVAPGKNVLQKSLHGMIFSIGLIMAQILEKEILFEEDIIEMLINSTNTFVMYNNYMKEKTTVKNHSIDFYKKYKKYFNSAFNTWKFPDTNEFSLTDILSNMANAVSTHHNTSDIILYGTVEEALQNFSVYKEQAYLQFNFYTVKKIKRDQLIVHFINQLEIDDNNIVERLTTTPIQTIIDLTIDYVIAVTNKEVYNTINNQITQSDEIKYDFLLANIKSKEEQRLLQENNQLKQANQKLQETIDISKDSYNIEIIKKDQEIQALKKEMEELKSHTKSSMKELNSLGPLFTI